MSGPTRRRRSYGAARRPLSGVVVAACAALALAACSGGATGAKDSADSGSGDSSTAGVTDSTVKIAYIGDLSGPDAGTELTYFKGIKAAIDVANKNGGAGGRTIELATGDTKFDTAQAITEFKKYTSDDPALAILGINVSSMFEALDPRIKEAKVPIVGPVGVTQLTLDNPYVYQAQADLPTSAAAISKFMAAQLGGSPKVGVATISTASGDEWYDLFKKVAPEIGATVTGHQKMDPAAVEAAAQVAQLQKDGDTAVTLHAGGGGGIALVKSMVTGGLDVPVYSTFGANGPALWEAAGALAPKVFAFDAFAPPDSDVAGRTDLEAAMRANGDWDEFKDEKNYAEGWVIGNVVVQALDAAGDDLTRGTFTQALQSPDGYDTGGYSAPINWSENNGLSDPSSIKAFTFDPAQGRIVEVTTP
jgi:branched-chain amino acid transport system substrate-binding protein